MAQVRGLDFDRCLVIPGDVGKAKATALVADQLGELVVEPFEFGLTEPGFATLATHIGRAEADGRPLQPRAGPRTRTGRVAS